MGRYRQVERCRVCGGTNLVRVLDLGDQVLTGVFPPARDASITSGPVHLVKCHDEAGCGLLQLGHTYDAAEMYGENYGYRSGLNPSMVSHLREKVRRIRERLSLTAGDLVLDIGSNDSTTLQAYPEEGLVLVGMDPSAGKFRSHYLPHIELIEDFFTARRFAEQFPGRKARVVTSFAMFYDLEEPMEFMRQVHEILADDGIWVFEQSYMPAMLEANAYDTVCQEHLEFYGLRQIHWMAERVGFQVDNVEFNDTNGGSFSVTVTKSASPVTKPGVQEILDRERDLGLQTLVPYREFAQRVAKSKEQLTAFVREAVASGKSVAALGASTKGNVLLQYCGFTEADIFAVGEVNPDKFGSVTPGTWLPIIPEEQLFQRKPDYLLVLPWHFRGFFVNNARFAGMRLVFPLPELEIVSP